MVLHSDSLTLREANSYPITRNGRWLATIGRLDQCELSIQTEERAEMPDPISAQRRTGDSESDRQTRVPLTARLLLHQSLTARRAAGIIAGFTFLITVGGGFLERVLDRKEYPTIGKGLWFSLETVTTVGYGDVTPSRAVGRIIAAVLMLTAIGFLAVITASVTASLVESSRRRFVASSEADVNQRLDEVSSRLARIEGALTPARSGGSADGIN